MSPVLPPIRIIDLSPVSGPISVSPSVPGTVSVSKCKHSALNDASSNSSLSLSFLTSVSHEKKSRVSGGSAVMNCLNDILDRLGAHLAKVEKQQQQLAAIQDTSPEWRSKAMHKLQKDGHTTSHCSCQLVQLFYRSCWYISGTFSWWPWDALDWKAADGELGFPAVEPSWHDHVVDLQYITHGLFLCYCCIHVIYACCIHLCCQCHCKKNV